MEIWVFNLKNLGRSFQEERFVCHSDLDSEHSDEEGEELKCK